MTGLRSRIGITAAVLAGALALAGCSAGHPDASSSASTSAKPKAGGSITIGGLVTTALDPGQLGYSLQSQSYTEPMLGSLFRPGLKVGDPVRPGIASGYKYNSDKTELTITLRPNLKYSDGTTLDAASVVWNLKRTSAAGLTQAQYFPDVKSIVATNDTTVTLTFVRPYTLLLEALAYTPAGYLESETALEKEGANKFNQAPVGAGPYMAKSVDPGNQLVLVKNPNYWDASHVYLDQLTWINTGTDPQAAYVKLQSNAVQVMAWAGTSTSSVVLSQAKSNPQLNLVTSTSTNYQMLPMNTTIAPFNNIQAREAIAYCTDRETLAKNVLGGFAYPAYITSGPDSADLTKGDNGKSLNKYSFSVSKGKALVKQLGGLTFNVTNNAPSAVLSALQQQWAACGITANIVVNPAYLTTVQNGTYQMAFTVGANVSFDPTLITTYQDPTTANGKDTGVTPEITTLINKAKGLEAGSASAKSTWQQIWKGIHDLAITIPVVSGPAYVFSNKCLTNVQTFYGYNSGGVFDNAYLTCSVN